MYIKIDIRTLCICLCFSLIAISSCKENSQNSQETLREAPTADLPADSTSGQNEVITLTKLGNPVGAVRAKELTDNYWNTLSSATRDDDAKSVYFTKAELDVFAQNIINAQLCTQESIGYRFYFAKYKPNDTTTPFRGQHTIVIRATCDGKDIPHQIVSDIENVHVAYDFGDVCPPRCDLANPSTVHQNGRYNVNGNCIGCPN
jgi:hypothetical protein